MKGPIAYIMSRFPHLSETFILREMDELAALNWDIRLFPLVLQNQDVVHRTALEWIDNAYHYPFISFEVVKANIANLIHNPFRYISLWFQTIRENIVSPKFFFRAIALFPKTVLIANNMEQMGIRHIHAHYATHPAFVAWLIYKLTGITYSFTVHAHDIFVDKTMLKTKLQDAVFIIAISEFNREHLVHAVGNWVREKINIVHCGIIPENYKLPPKIREQTDRFNILSIGSLQPYKGFSYLIEACAILQEKGIPFRCQIIGGGEDYTKLNKTIRSLKLEKYVSLLGPKTQDEVTELLKQAHCYVQPSVITPSGKMEGIPVALMEALASGLPVVATSISGIPEIIQPNKTGYLVNPEDSTALAETIAEVYTNQEQALKLANTGRELVLREFDLTSNVNQLANLFLKTINQTPITREIS